MEPLGWDEIVSQPGMGGYLSFLNGPVPLPHLQGSAAGLAPDPGVDLHPGTDPCTAIQPRSEADASPVVASDSRIEKRSDTEPYPGAARTPVSEIILGGQQQVTESTPEVLSIPAVATQRLRIRRCSATHDGHSLGEEVLYQALWKAAQAESADTRTIVIGWRGMSQLCRMTPKNCKINTQRLIRKLALGILSRYNTPESIGTTYRVYSDSAILERRREAGLEWVVRSRGVEFVDPATGISILPICAQTYQSDPR